MQPDLVLVKTPQGLAEFEHRSSTLTMRMRRLLMMVDGQHTVAALIHFHASSFDVVTALWGSWWPRDRALAQTVPPRHSRMPTQARRPARR